MLSCGPSAHYGVAMEVQPGVPEKLDVTLCRNHQGNVVTVRANPNWRINLQVVRSRIGQPVDEVPIPGPLGASTRRIRCLTH